MTLRTPTTLVLLALLSFSTACRRAELSGPPELRVGRDQCAECGMLISEDRCSAAVLYERDRERLHAIFDDIGCLLDWRRATHDPPQRVLETYLRDYDARAWIHANTASILRADRDRLHTPMGSGIVAFAHAADAEARRDEFGGDLTSYAALLSPLTPPAH
ncbi:MAG: nitrous oxide reductase accessory protein NosL [Phycisphaerales bacterium]